MRISPDALFQESWSLVKGAKFPFFLTFFVMVMIEMLIALVNMTLNRLTGVIWINTLAEFLLPAFFIAPFITGLVMMGLKRARGELISSSSGFAYFKILPRLFLAFLIEGIILWLFLVVLSLLLILFLFFTHIHISTLISPTTHEGTFGFVFGVLLVFLAMLFVKSLLLFNFLLVADQDVSPFIAWYRSIKMALHQFRAVFFSLLFLALINLGGLCLLGLGLIWTIPLTFIVIGRLFTLCQQEV